MCGQGWVYLEMWMVEDGGSSGLCSKVCTGDDGRPEVPVFRGMNG